MDTSGNQIINFNNFYFNNTILLQEGRCNQARASSHCQAGQEWNKILLPEEEVSAATVCSPVSVRVCDVRVRGDCSVARGVQLQRRCQAAEVEDQWLHLLCVHTVQDRVTLSLQYRHRGQYPLLENI